MKVARIHQHGGSGSTGLRRDSRPGNQGQRSTGAGPRLRAQSSRSVRARRYSRHEVRTCRTFWAATSPGRLWPGGRFVRARQAGLARAAFSGPELPAMRAVPYRARTITAADTPCSEYADDGGNAELLAAPEYSAIPIPDDLSFEEAAAGAAGFSHRLAHADGACAFAAGRRRVGAGGVRAASGSAAIQIAKMFQCRVIATAGGEQKLARARELGADYRHRSLPQDISAEVKKITGEKRRRCGGGACGRGHVAEEPGIAGSGRPPGHLRRHYRLRRQAWICATSSANSGACWARSWAPWASCTRC